ncbi:hypothetical protein [Halorubrum sp. DM2]|uniref:hypothetical protein n=1 Tax=Halorubrum sp. DM2 TaxID=2527867 RepID=UPI0024B751D4|nr:hypothetical protein [Halorubrum sp. DM2]
MDAVDRDFSSADDFVSYLEKDYNLGEVPESVNFIGAINDCRSEKAFIDSLGSHFDRVDSTGDLYLLKGDTGEEYVPYYVYVDDEFPVFITTANITDEMPPTINSYLQQSKDVGRFWLSKRQMEALREELISRYDGDILIPFFSAKRGMFSEIGARKRPGTKRRITYYADDGLETYREMRMEYGVLPTILEFERPNHFKFRVKDKGVFVHESGSVQELWRTLKKETEHKSRIKEYIDTGEATEPESTVFQNKTISVSRPWGIKVDPGLHRDHLDGFKSHLQNEELEFGVSEYNSYPEIPSFDAELIDHSSYETTKLMTKEDTIQVYPRELTDVDQSFRIYNFVSDHFGPKCEPVAVE